MLAPWLRAEETCSPPQNLVRAFQLTTLLLQALNLRNTIRGDTTSETVVNVSLYDPHPDRFNPLAKLQCDPLSGSQISSQLSPQGPHHPNRSILLFSRIPPTSFPVFVDDSILVSKV